VQEAIRLGIPVVSLVDTNSDPDPISYVIPGNDDAIRSIKLVTRLLADAILEGQQAYLAGQAEVAAKAAAERKAQEQPEEEIEQKPQEISVLDLLAEPPVDEVEAIIPPTVLKAKVEMEEFKKKAPKAKPEVKEKNKEPAGG